MSIDPRQAVRRRPQHNQSNRATPLRRKPVAQVISVALCGMAFYGGQPGTAHAQVPSTQAAQAAQSYNIPAGALSPALRNLASAANVLLVFTEDQTAGKTTSGIRGQYAPQAALAALLAGTGLQAVPMENGGYLLRAAGAATAGAVEDKSGTLPQVTVAGSADPNPVTEGTGTYAAQAASMFMGAKTLREIPQSISVLTREQMDDQGMTRLSEALSYLPGVRLSGFADTEGIRSRGFLASEQIDGVPQEGSGFQLDPVIYDRIEMIRGPSGLLAGSGEPGGAVNYVRKRPKDHFAFAANLSVGSWNNRRTEVDVTGPLNESGTLRGRLVGMWQEKDEYYDVAHEQRKLLYGVLEYDLTTRDTLAVAATRMEIMKNRNWGLPFYTDGSLPGRSAFVGSDRASPVNTDELMLEHRHRFDNGWQSKATFTQRREDITQRSVWGTSALDLATGRGTAYTLYTHDINTFTGINASLSGPFEVFGRTHTATIGYGRSEYFNNYLAYNLNSFTDQSTLERHDWGSALDTNDSGRRYEKIVQKGFYGSTGFKLADPLTLVLGARISDYASHTRQYNSDVWVKNPEAAKGRVTPYAGLIVDLNSRWSVYGSYADIFVPQSGKVYQGGALKPRTGEQFELGLKGSLMDGRLNVATALYQLRDKNRAVDDNDPTHICPDSDSGLCSRAAGLIQSRGWETEVSGTVLPGLNLSASYTYNRSVYLHDGDPANIGQTVDPAMSPRHLMKAWAQYRFSERETRSDWDKWTVGGGMIAQSEIYRDFAVNSTEGVKRFRQGTYAVFSAKLGYQVNKNVSATLDVHNLFNRTYLDQLGYAGFWNIYGAPRSVRLSLVYKFE